MNFFPRSTYTSDKLFEKGLMKARFILCGTSASMGIPIVGCSCAVCSSPSPYNKRLRPTVLIELEKKRFLIDVGPDFREQALTYNLKRVDGLLLTHTHYDHIAGVDDLRMYAFYKEGPIPCLMSKETFEEMKTRYHYLFHEDTNKKPKFTYHVLEEDRGDVVFEGMKLSYVSYKQNGMKVTGFRFKDLAYLTDIKQYDDKLFDKLQGVKTLIISAINWKATRAHFGIEDVINFAKHIHPDKIYITHIGHEMDHEQTNKALPEAIKLCYDGMTLDFHVDTQEKS